MTSMKRALGRVAVVAAVVLVLSGLAADATMARQRGTSNSHEVSQTGG
jgi:hypothetical protein